MRRRIFNFAVLLSLIACTTTVVLWKRRGVEYSVAYQSENAYWYLVCSEGRFVCGVVPSTWMPRGLSIASSDNSDGISSAIVTDIVYPNGHISHWKNYDIPCSTVAAATGILPVLWACALASRLRRRLRRGFCCVCEYNLAGNTSGICPECGTALAPEMVGAIPLAPCR